MSRRRSGRNRPPLPSPPPVHPAERPPDPPQELRPDPTEMRRFMDGDEEWLAWVSGKSAAGTGQYGLGMIVAIHFAPAAEPAPPRFEALLPRGRFRVLYDTELRRLLHAATRVVLPERDGPDRR